MISKEEIENMKIGLWNIRAENLRAMQCSLANTSDKIEWQKNFDAIDNALKYIKQLESREQKLIEKLEEINTRNVELYNSPKQKEVDFSEWNLAQELLEILKKE